MILTMVPFLCALLAQDPAALGNEAYVEGRYAEAADYFEKALAKEKTAPLWLALGHASLQAGRWEAAIRAYREAIALKADTADLHRSLGQALAMAGRLDEAIASLRKAGTMDPEGPDSLSIARIQAQREEWLQAEHEIALYLRVSPSSIEAQELLGYVLSRQAKWAEAGAVYRGLSRRRPGEGKYLLAWAQAEASQRRYAEAADVLEVAARLGSADAEALRLLADLYLQQEMHREAAAAYARMLAATKEPRADDFLRLGQAYVRTGEAASARRAFEKARALDPSSSAASLQLGHLAAARGEADLARKDFSEAMKAAQGAEACEALGNFELQQGRFEAAAEAYREALRRGSSTVSAHYNLAFSLHSAGKTDSAILALREALREHPTDDRLRTLFGNVVR